jgi:hypothetical protein
MQLLLGYFSYDGKNYLAARQNLHLAPHFMAKANEPVKVKLSHYTPWRRLGGEEV